MKIFKRIIYCVMLLVLFIGLFTVIPVIIYWIVTGKNYLEIMKSYKMALVILLIFITSCSIKPICRIDEHLLILTDKSWNGVWTAESINHCCQTSFTIEGSAKLKDTVIVKYLRYASVSSNFPARVKVISVK
jgi:hypothetical protein